MLKGWDRGRRVGSPAGCCAHMAAARHGSKWLNSELCLDALPTTTDFASSYQVANEGCVDISGRRQSAMRVHGLRTGETDGKATCM